MCGIVGAVARENVVPILIEGITPPRVSRLRFDRPGGDQRRHASPGQHRRASPISRRRPTATQRRRHHRHLAHALGHARRADVDQRASACQQRRDRRRAQRHHRELRGAARALQAQGYEFVTQTDTEVIAHLIHAHYERRPARRRARGDGGIPRRVRDRGDHHARARPHRRRARRQPAAGRRRRAAIIFSPPMPARCRRSRGASSISKKATSPTSRVEAYAIYDATGSAVSRPVVTVQGLGRCGRARPVPPLHAEGDLRAAARDRRHAGQRRRHRARICSATTRPRSCPRSTPCRSSRAAPATTRAWSRGCGSRRSPAFRRRPRSPANTAIATAFPIPTRWSSSSRNRAKRPTRWRR